MARYTIGLLTGLAILCSVAGTARADVYWSSTATACVPDQPSIKADRYQKTQNSYVSFKGAAVGKILLACAIPEKSSLLNPQQVSITYKDATGTNPAGHVSARLVAVNRFTGVEQTIASVNSDGAAGTVVGKFGSAPFNHTINFSTFFYQLSIELQRKASSQDVRAYGVALETVCGNGTIDAGEFCDDSNSVGGDGCSATCSIEACGNGTIDVGEQCDDGNTVSGDGCSQFCLNEP